MPGNDDDGRVGLVARHWLDGDERQFEIRSTYRSYEDARRSALNGIIAEIRRFMDELADGNRYFHRLRRELLQEPRSYNRILDQIIDWLKITEYPSNAVDIQVRGGGDGYFTSYSEIESAHIIGRGMNPLSYTVEGYRIRTAPDDAAYDDGKV